MAESLTFIGATTGTKIYALLNQDSDGNSWNISTSLFQVFQAANYSNYAIILTETASGSRVWIGAFPDVPYQLYNITYCSYTTTPADTDPVIGGESRYPSGPVSQSTGSALLSVAEYRIANTSASSDERLANLIIYATAIIENAVDAKLTQVAYSEIVSGQGTGFVALRFTPNVVSSVVMDYTSDDPTTYASGYTLDGNVLFWSSLGIDYFPYGYKNIKINYTTYDSTTLADLKAACAILVRRLEHTLSQDANTTAMRLKDQSINYAQYANGLLEEIEGIIRPYRRLLCV